jgi:hypothetical protein
MKYLALLVQVYIQPLISLVEGHATTTHPHLCPCVSLYSTLHGAMCFEKPMIGATGGDLVQERNIQVYCVALSIINR